MLRTIPCTGHIPHRVTPSCTDCPGMVRSRLGAEWGQEANPAPHLPRQICPTGKAQPPSRGQIEAISPLFVLASPGLAVVSVHYSGQLYQSHPQPLEKHTEQPWSAGLSLTRIIRPGEQALGLGVPCWESTRGDQPQDGAEEGFFYPGDSRAESLLSHPHPELLLLRWDLCVLGGRSS